MCTPDAKWTFALAPNEDDHRITPTTPHYRGLVRVGSVRAAKVSHLPGPQPAKVTTQPRRRSMERNCPQLLAVGFMGALRGAGCGSQRPARKNASVNDGRIFRNKDSVDSYRGHDVRLSPGRSCSIPGTMSALPRGRLLHPGHDVRPGISVRPAIPLLQEAFSRPVSLLSPLPLTAVTLAGSPRTRSGPRRHPAWPAR